MTNLTVLFHSFNILPARTRTLLIALIVISILAVAFLAVPAIVEAGPATSNSCC